jgi:hypothetical protein
MFFCLFALEKKFLFVFPSIGFIVVSLHNLNTHINIAKGNYNLQNPNICSKFFPLQKFFYKYFVLLSSVKMILKNNVFY